MAGARGNLGRSFESAPDMGGLGAESADDEVRRSSATPLLLKRAGEDDWRPLLAEPSPA